MKTKTFLFFLIIIIIVGNGAFYGGMKYGQSRNSLTEFSRQRFPNLSSEQRQQFLQGRIGRSPSNFIFGEIIDKDEKSLTIKTPDGGSKIILLSDSTKISKTIIGSPNDIEVGKQVMISGLQNQDGSYVARIIQISPLLFNLK